MRISTTHDLASAVRGRRRELGISQAELAMRAKVSRDWVNTFERGKHSVDLSLVLDVLDALGLEVSVDTTGAHTRPRTDDASDLESYLDEYMSR
jgi:y4mF family transcriptional regulator